MIVQQASKILCRNDVSTVKSIFLDYEQLRGKKEKKNDIEVRNVGV